MPRRTPAPDPEPPKLTVAKDDFTAELDDRVGRGKRLLEEPITSSEAVEALRRQFYTWNDYNAELLRKRFTTSELARDYKTAGGVIVIGGSSSLAHEIKDLKEDIDAKIRYLESVKERLPLFDEVSPAEPVRPRTPQQRARGSGTIFVVHGHDEQIKAEVLRFLSDVTEIVPVVLHEQANQGRTIIEKFEDHAADAAFAVVLITPDDEGRERGTDEPLSPRARQNVVLELGFFFGALGRARVAALYAPGTQLPSDMSGVLYTEWDQRGAWKMELAREMSAAGLAVDLNKTL